MRSIFLDKDEIPSLELLRPALGEAFGLWARLHGQVMVYCPGSTEEWKFAGVKSGWSFRISDRRRVLLYFLPREGFFKVAFVFGPKAVEKVLASKVSTTIKEELLAAKPFAEGRGIRIEVRDPSVLEDILFLLAIKVSN